MAANYWASTQRRHWLFSREQLAEIRENLKEKDKLAHQQFPLPDSRLLNIYFNQQLTKLGKRMSTRQQALATAQVYIKRFYTKVEIRQTNPYLVLTTAFYLACKMEECPQHIRFVVGEARGLWPDFISSDVAKLGECEFSLISEMSSQLIVHHPYRTLTGIQTELGLTSDEVALAWSVINDHYLTDLPLLYPPHVIAVMAIIVAVVFKPSQTSFHGTGPPSLASAIREGGAGVLAALGDKNAPGPPARIQKIITFLAESEVDIKAVIECTQELVSLYEVWEQYSEKHCRELIGRMVKSKNLDK
ncbi:RNA polymerase II holoenzyme cyclin-like subunit [Paecilomyces variotii No. 5]|uniref:RNA polymerase II holoenzyme cyclin-like subunit n=1 Tax=Byssochlamys spectabilis (strain No. 5 / NBRC 109023) TaxID=1356009 RepID=V5FT21_BYSSN|nr:RNA polymerase II holoenzyme cyclin-like subunit [Paecilomyces variotii No. 5]